MKILGRFLLLTVCVTALSFGAIIDDFSVAQLPGAQDITANLTAVTDALGNRTLSANHAGTPGLTIAAQVTAGEYFGSAAGGVNGTTGANYAGGLWDLSAPGSYLAIDLINKDNNLGSLQFTISDGVFTATSGLFALGAPGTIFADVLSFSGLVDVANVTSVGFSVLHGNDLDLQLDNFRTGSIPEPGTYAMMAAGLLVVFAARRRKA